MFIPTPYGTYKADGYNMKIITLLATLLLTGCCVILPNRATVYPDKLPVAIVGEKYQASIYVEGTPVSSMSIKVGDDYSDEYVGNGLKLSSVRDGLDTHVNISGVPEKEGELIFRVGGGTMGTQCPGACFDKEYTLEVMSKMSKSR
ncbi:MAG: hypothetical protein P0Y63_08195 [Klebsiella huaxiensis]|uniref:hypothetical protein n=1 Tax=Klebsiella huaxiensis TaxID=2153354 RepID=UPI0026F1FBC7|nr:hypothetical protein [Klebsiella huaxiensis]WEJ90986.1 MAG: hypothetical protein P0Y63_08195 [Klebsiella huaxiensis]